MIDNNLNHGLLSRVDYREISHAEADRLLAESIKEREDRRDGALEAIRKRREARGD